MKVLVTRTDRLGDVVLSLPVFTYLARARPDWEIHALVNTAAAPLVENDPCVHGLWTTDDPAAGDLPARLAEERFDMAILLWYRRELAALLQRIGVRTRIGPLSKLSSWWYLTSGVRQARSRAVHHEWEYNLQLAARAAGPVGQAVSDAEFPIPRLDLTDVQRTLGQRFRAEEAGSAEVVAFVHPGSGGSALDWELERFAEVTARLAAQPGFRVFVTGSHHDRLRLDELKPMLAPEVTVIAERFELREFLGVLSGGDLMIAPSTGPLHMAAALGLAAVGLFPPVATMSARRWGAVGTFCRSLEPAVTCPAKKYCLLERCLLHNCLRGLVATDVVDAALAAVRARQNGMV